MSRVTLANLNRSLAIEWAGAISGIAGALLLAGMYSPALGFAAFLLSNIAWLVFSCSMGHWAMFVQQLMFLATSLLGLWNWWLMPLLARGDL